MGRYSMDLGGQRARAREGRSWACRLAILAVLAGFSSCHRGAGAGAGQHQQTIVITGASTIAPLAAEMGKRFEKAHPGVRVDVQTGGSSRGVLDARQGLADIGMVSRALKPDEHDLIPVLIARDGVAMILHRDNPVHVLSKDQIIGIYTGTIRSWKEVGGRDRPIVVISKAEGRSTLDLFLHYFQLKNSQIKASVIVGDNEQDIKMIAENGDAIGYVSIGTAEVDVGDGVPIQLLPLDGIVPSTATVQNGTFPLARPLNLVTKAPPMGLVKEFIDFATSAAAQSTVTEQHFVSLSRS